MMYNNSGERIEEIKNFCSDTRKPYRMAEVTSIINGRPMVRFYGELNPSLKKYKYLSSYHPAAGDMVLMVKIENTYVILGKAV